MVPALERGEALAFGERLLMLNVDIGLLDRPVSKFGRSSPSLDPILLCPELGAADASVPLIGCIYLESVNGVSSFP